MLLNHLRVGATFRKHGATKRLFDPKTGTQVLHLGGALLPGPQELASG
jgi:hypothetical protein